MGLRLNIQKTKIMASGPITSWQIDGETMETVADFISLGSKITADGDCSHKIKRRLLLGRKVMTNLDSILKSRHITLPTKVHLVKVLVFLVVMNGCESWTIKKADHWIIDAFELCFWRRLLRVPWTVRRSNQSILKESVLKIHWKDWCWSRNSNTLATWCEELTHWKDPDAEKDWKQEEKRVTEDAMVGWHHRLNEHEFEQAPGAGDGQESLVCCDSWGRKRVGHDWATELNNSGIFFHFLEQSQNVWLCWNPVVLLKCHFYNDIFLSFF